MTSPYADIRRRLAEAIVTASNDDTSAPGTPERERHVARLAAMEDAITALAAPAVTEENAEQLAYEQVAAGHGWPAWRLMDEVSRQRFVERVPALVAEMRVKLALPAAIEARTIRPPEPTGPGPETYPGHDPAAGLPGADGAAAERERIAAKAWDDYREFLASPDTAAGRTRPAIVGVDLAAPGSDRTVFHYSEAAAAAIRAEAAAEATAAERERCLAAALKGVDAWIRRPLHCHFISLEDHLVAAIRGGDHD